MSYELDSNLYQAKKLYFAAKFLDQYGESFSYRKNLNRIISSANNSKPDDYIEVKIYSTGPNSLTTRLIHKDLEDSISIDGKRKEFINDYIGQVSSDSFKGDVHHVVAMMVALEKSNNIEMAEDLYSSTLSKPAYSDNSALILNSSKFIQNNHLYMGNQCGVTLWQYNVDTQK